MLWISSSQPLHQPASTWRMASARPKCLRITSPSCWSIWRRVSSGCGGGSLTIPVFAICLSSRYMSEVLSAIGKIEGFVDQRKVRDDIAEDGALEQRPVLPRRIVRMRAMDPVGIGALERDQHFSAPALDPADAAFAGDAIGERSPDRARCKLAGERPHQAHRLEH